MSRRTSRFYRLQRSCFRTACVLSALVLPAGAHAAPPKLPAPKFVGRVQAWATLYDQDQDPVADPASYGDPEDDPGLKLRRARVGVRGADHHLRYLVVVGVESPYDLVQVDPETGVYLVYGTMGISLLHRKDQADVWLDVGRDKVPVGRELLISSSRLVLAERTVMTEWIDPGTDVGAVLDGRTRGENNVRLRLGVFNGTDDFTGNKDGGLLTSGRVEFNHGPGNTYRTWGKVESFTFGIGADGWIDDSRATRTVGYGADLMVRVQGLAVLAEARQARYTPTDTTLDVPGVLAPTTRRGAFIQAGYSVGGLEPAVRYGVFDDDASASDSGDVAEAVGGITWHGYEDGLRIGGGYVARIERGGRSYPNDTARLWMQVKW